MKRALKKFDGYNNTIKIDGQKIFDYNEKTFFIKKGDSSSISIASASILAKTYRDNLMNEYSKDYPVYKWNKNKGYGTQEHFCSYKKIWINLLTQENFFTKKLNNRNW